MRIMQDHDTEELVKSVNNRIAESIQNVKQQSQEFQDRMMAEGLDLEFLPRRHNDIVLYCFPLNGVRFSAVHSVVQIGAMRPGVVALADSEGGPVLLVADDGRRVDHEPRLKQVLEDNAADIMRGLGLGTHVFAIHDNGATLRLRVLNGPLWENGDPVKVGDGKTVLSSPPDWDDHTLPPRYVRVAGQQTIITIQED